MTAPANPVVGVLLAGGKSRRMGGGDKCLLPFHGRPLLASIVERVAPQVSQLIVNANGIPERFAAFGLPVVADTVPGHAGPLAGVLTGMEWVAEHVSGCAWIATFACDAPFQPRDLVTRLDTARRDAGADMACAVSGGRDHPVFGLWPLALRGALRSALTDSEIRKVDTWTAHYRMAKAVYQSDSVDPFYNINTPEDLEQAEKIPVV